MFVRCGLQSREKPMLLLCSPLSFHGVASALEKTHAPDVLTFSYRMLFLIPCFMSARLHVSSKGQENWKWSCLSLWGEVTIGLAPPSTPGHSLVIQPSAKQMDNGTGKMKIFM